MSGMKVGAVVYSPQYGKKTYEPDPKPVKKTKTKRKG